MNEELIRKHMTTLGCTRDEAIQLIMEDEETDGMTVGQINKELTPEQRKAVKANSKTTSGKTKQTTPKERKKDEEKRTIIAELFEIAKKLDENAEIANPEKEINIKIGENCYTIGLTKHRPPKK